MKLIATVVVGLLLSGMSAVAVVQTADKTPSPVDKPLVTYGER